MTDPFRDPSQITNAFDQFEQNNGPLTRVPASPPVQAPALRRVPQERFNPTPDQITSAFDQLAAKRREEADARATLQSENILKNLTPEMVARVRRVSREQGLSIPLARDAVVEELNKQDTQSFLRTLRRNPGLQAVSTQKGYADLRDDFEALELVEMAGNSVKSYADDYQAGDLFRDIGRGAVQGAGLLVQGAGDLLQAGGRSITAAEAALIESLPGIEEGEGKGVLGRLITFGAKETLSDPGLVMNDIAVAIGVPQERRTFLNDVTSGTGQLVSQIAVVLATGGSPLVMGALGLTQGAGEQGQMQREQDAFGTPEGDAALVTGGTVSAVLERFNLDKIINKIPASARNRVMRAVAGGVSEGGTEFAQSLSQQLTALGFYSDDTLDFNESAYEGGVGAAVGAIISGALPGRGRGARATTEELRNAVDDGPVEAAQAAQVELEIARRAVEESKTFSRDPEAIREILDAAGPQEVTLPVEAIDQLLQDGTLTETELDALGITEQLAVQSQISGEVKTTASQLITLEGDAFSELARNTRLAPGQLTAAEAETQVAEREGDVQRLLEELERSEAAELASRNFQTQIADDIRAAGRPAIEAQQAAAILAARYEARAEQFDGVTAAELYAEDNLRIGQIGQAQQGQLSQSNELEGLAENTIMVGDQPLRLFHGTRADFTDFNDGTIFFSSRRGLAVDHALRSGEGTPRVVEATVAMENPVVVGPVNTDPDTYWLRNTVELEQQLQDDNVDGLLIYNESGETVAIVKRNDQITQQAGPAATASDISVDGVSASVSETAEIITLNRIVANEQGQGAGTAYMQQLVDYADRVGKTLALTPSGDFGGSVKRLREFYSRFGFVPNKGRAKDFRTQESFIREPQVAPEQLFQPFDVEGSDAFIEWAGTTDPVIEADEINDTDFSGEGPFVVRAFHGTTHDFDVFDASIKGTVEGQFGAVNYFTSSEADASDNYTSGGPDLTNRIENRQEQLENEIEDRWAELSDGLETDEQIEEAFDELVSNLDELSPDLDTGSIDRMFVDNDPQEGVDVAALAAALASRELQGGEEQVLEVYVRTEKPFVVGGENAPFIELLDNEQLERDAIEQVAENNDISVEEVEADRDTYEDEIDEARWELEADQESELFTAIQSVASRYDLDAQEIYGGLMEHIDPDGVDTTTLEGLLRGNDALTYAEDPETGQLISSHVLALIINEMGFDSIILKDADQRFSNMNMEQGTAHVHVFDNHNTNIKSATDNVGTFDRTDPSILQQAAPAGPRGTFTPSSETRPDNLIELGPEANATTFMHEASHLFAYQVARDLADPRLSEQGRANLQRQSDAARRWFGQNSKDAWRDLQKLAKQERRGVSDTTAMQDAVARAKASGDPVAYMQGVAEAFMNPEAAGRDKAAEVAFHELWARGFEKYLGTGTAPSSGLREAFASFSTWITNVYRQLRSLNVELSPEITDVFDRLLASEEAIAAEQEQRLYRVPQEIRDAATPEEVQRLAELADEAELEAKIEMQSRVSRGLVQAETEARNQRREELTDEVRERLEKENPAYAALRVIQDQEMPDGTEVTPVILDRTEVEGLIGKEWASRFPRGTMKRNPTGEQKPIPMSDLASLVSLDSPYELAEVMAPVDGLTPIEDAVAAEVEQRMVEEFGTEAAQDLERQQQAMAAVMNEKFGELQVLQARILGRLAEADLQRAAEQEAEQEGAGSAAQDRQAVEDAEVEEQLAGETGDTSAAVNAAFKRLKAQAKRRANIRARRTQSANRRQLEAARRAIDPATINLAADQFVEQMQIADATPGRYRQTADRLTRRIERAIVARDYAMASALLEQRALNTAIARRVADVQDRVQKQRKKWVKLTSRSDKRLAQTYDIDYINAIRVLLNPIDFANLPQSMNFDAALALGQLQQSEPALYAELTSAITQTQQRLQKAMDERQGRDAYKDLTTLEFEQLMKLAENLRTNARDNRSMLADGDRVHFGTVAQMIDVEVDKKRRQRKAPPPDEGRGKTGKRSRMQMIGNYKAALRRVELWARAFDNGRFDGPMQKFLVRPVMAAVNEYNARRGEPQDRLVELLKDNREVGRPMEIAAPELDGYRFQSKAELLHFVLHMGNASNKRKLLIGGAKDIASDRQYVWGEDTENGVDDTQAQAFLDRMFREGVLTKSDMDLVQGIWDTFETTKVAAQAAHKKMYGYNFQEVEATPMQTPFGEYKGGYVPAVTDYMMNPDGQRFEAEEIMSQQSNAAMFPGAEDGFTKSRVEYNRPMNLDLSTLPAHLDRVMKYAYLAPTIRNAARMVTNDAFRAAVGRHDPYVIDRTIIPWLQRTAQQVVQSPPANSGEGQIGRWVARLQRNVGLHVMTANLVNAAQQITGLPSALTRVKLRHLLAAHTDLRQEDGWVWQHIANRSKFMQTRMSNGTNEAMTTVSNILKDKSVLSRSQDFAMRYGYFAQQQMQNMIDPIVWMAADRQAQEEIVPAIYEEALARTGSEQLAREAADKAAVEFADQVVRDTQSPMQASDISGIEASGPMLRLYLQFYSYFNNMGNLLATEVQIAHNSEMGVAGRWGRYAYAFAMTVTVPAVLAEGIKMAATGGFEAEDEEDLRDTLIHVGLGSQVQTLLLMDPALGKLASAAYGAAFTDSIYDDRISAAGVGAADSLIKTWSRAVRAIADPDTDGEVAASARAFLDTAGIALGLPTNWLNKPLRYAERVAEGDADPQGLVDIMQGIVTGRDGTE